VRPRPEEEDEPEMLTTAEVKKRLESARGTLDALRRYL
jgi:hypothetical protein